MRGMYYQQYLSKANEALHWAKQQGRNRTVLMAAVAENRNLPPLVMPAEEKPQPAH